MEIQLIEDENIPISYSELEAVEAETECHGPQTGKHKLRADCTEAGTKRAEKRAAEMGR